MKKVYQLEGFRTLPMQDKIREHIPYNTEDKALQLPEYGRLVAQMIDKAKEIESKEKRTICAHEIIRVMEGLTPENKGIEGYKQKLWDHLAYLSNYELDIDYPVDIRRIDEKEKPGELRYPGNKIKYMHYGNLLEKQLKEVCSIEDEEEQRELLLCTAQRMKKNLIEWKGEQGDLDQKVGRDIEELSEGKIQSDFVITLLESNQRQGKTNRKK